MLSADALEKVKTARLGLGGVTGVGLLQQKTYSISEKGQDTTKFLLMANGKSHIRAFDWCQNP